MGVAPQDLGVYLKISVKRNLVLFGRLAGLSRTDLAQRIGEVGEALHLTHLFDRPAVALSGGEKRRLHTAIALLHHPRVLLLDEPTAGADVQTRQDILGIVRQLAGDGTAVCYTTHYFQEVEALSPTVVILDQGRVVTVGSIDAILARDANAFVEITFDGQVPSLPLEGVVSSDGATVRIATTEPHSCITTILDAAGREIGRIRGLTVVEPSLESVYLSLTRRSVAAESEGHDDRE
jgi:ABC-2 type transport system ATP-binding protein